MGKTNLVEIAARYAELNMTVVPAVDKRPFVKNWETASAEIILNNKGAWARANGLNIVLGKTSGIIVVDIDIIKKNNPVLFERVMALLPPAGIVQRIGNPIKQPSRFFQYSGETARKLNAIQVEILSDGNNCCLPPGWNHQSKTNFKWVGQSLLDIDADDLPILSEEVIGKLIELNEEIKEENKKAKGAGYKVITTEAKGRCRHGSHNVLSSYAVARRYAGYSEEQLIRDVEAYDRLMNKSSDRLYFNCKTRKWNLANSVTKNAEIFITEIIKNHKPPAKISENSKAYPSMADGFFVQVKDKEGKLTDKWAPDYHGMSEYFQKNQNLKNDDSYRCVYSSGFYSRLSCLGFDNKLLDLTKKRANPSALRNFKAMVSAKCFKSKDEFTPPVGMINTKDCVVNIDDKSTMAHSPEYNFLYKLPYTYDPKATCEEFLFFLNFIFFGDQNLINLIGEIIGYTLVGGDPFKHKAFLFFGEGRNGKSTLLDIIIEVLGKDSVSSVAMGNLDKPFSAVSLDGKLANIVEESPKNINPEAFKNIVGGGYITAARKGMDEFDLKVTARLYFAMNEFPHFKDNTTGLKERLEIIPFNRFIPEEERDYKLKGRLMLEIPGILNFALEGWQRLKKNSFQFSKSAASQEVLDEYILESDSILRWVDENIEQTNSQTDYIINDEMYQRYAENSKANGFFPKANIPFIKAVKKKYGKNCSKRKQIMDMVWNETLRRSMATTQRKSVIQGVKYVTQDVSGQG